MTVDILSLRNKFEGPHHFIVTSDNQTLFVRTWESAAAESKETTILLLHGITAYSGPYDMIANPRDAKELAQVANNELFSCYVDIHLSYPVTKLPRVGMLKIQ